MTRKSDISKTPQWNRRRLIISAGSTLLASNARLSPAAVEDKELTWHSEADVVVVGSGAAAGSAAAKALSAGASVIIIEKAAVWGGTTAKSAGWFWIPNNSFMLARGMKDPRDDALRYMARLAHPTSYIADANQFGLTPQDYQLLATFYDRAAGIVDDLAHMGALESQFVGGDEPTACDYASGLPENKAPIGRVLEPKVPKGAELGGGAVLAISLRRFVTQRGAQVYFKSRVVDLIQGTAGEIIGVQVESSDGIRFVRAKKAVIFGSGGFTHDPDLRMAHLRGPIFGGCAVPTNTGDFLKIATDYGASVGNLPNAWWAECVVEEALKIPSLANTLWVPPGRSMIYVNRLGRRVVDEHMMYNERTQAHFYWDPNRFEFINRVLIMIFDNAVRTADAGAYPVPPLDTAPNYLIRGDNLDQLSVNIDRRLKELSSKIGPIRLDSSFGENLKLTVARFSRFAREGWDEDFGRDSNTAGRNEALGETDLKDLIPTEGSKSTTGDAMRRSKEAAHGMKPLSTSGPYYAILIGAGTLDTKGGPRININAQVLRRSGQTIRGLYGAGNCIASPAGSAYFGPGATIAMALTYGYIAAEHATAPAAV